MKQATTSYKAAAGAAAGRAGDPDLQEIVRRVPVAEHVYAYARDLVRATRPSEPGVPAFIKEMVQWGAGPRASIYLILAGKARAILQRPRPRDDRGHRQSRPTRCSATAS